MDETVYGWCHPDGYIGLNHFIAVANPFTVELIYPWLQAAKLFPFLDLVVILTDRDDRPDLFNFLGYLDYLSFYQRIVCGIKVTGRVVEILDSTRAKFYYKQYNKLYGVHDVKYFKYMRSYDRNIGEELKKKPNGIAMKNWQDEAKEFISYPFFDLDSDSAKYNINKYYFKADHNSPAYNGHPSNEYYTQIMRFLGITPNDIVGVKPHFIRSKMNPNIDSRENLKNSVIIKKSSDDA